MPYKNPEDKKAYYWKNREKILAQKKIENAIPEIQKRNSINRKRHYYEVQIKDVNFKNKQKDSILRSKFGITLNEYNLMLEKQNNKCAICKGDNEDGWGNFAVDHDHITKKVRGLLCMHCNQGIGKFKDNIEFLNEAIKYLTLNK